MNEQPARSESTQAPVSSQPGYERPLYQQPLYQQPLYHQPLYQQPTVEWISLNCEISAYAPDEGDVPLF